MLIYTARQKVLGHYTKNPILRESSLFFVFDHIIKLENNIIL
jgi:hypothetical protein